MTWTKLSITDFSPGLRTDIDAKMIPSGAAASCENTVMDSRSLRIRPGRHRHSVIPTNAGSGPVALAEYNYGTTRNLFMATTSQLFKSSSANETFVTGDTSLACAISLASVGWRPKLQQFKNKLYVADGVNAIRRWDGGTTITALTEYEGPDYVGGVGTDYELRTSTNTDILGNSQSGFTYGNYYVRLNSLESNYGTRRDFLWMLYGSYAGSTDLSAFGTRIVNGAMMDLTAADDIRELGHTKATMIELIHSAGTDTAGKWIAIINLGGLKDLSTVNVIDIIMKRGWGADSVTVSLQLGQDDELDANKNLSGGLVSANLDMSGITEDNKWGKVSVDISGLSEAARKGISWIGLHFETLANLGTPDRIEHAGAYLPASEKAFWIAVDSIYSSDASENLTAGKYEFTWTYAYWDTGTATTIESPEYQFDYAPGMSQVYPSYTADLQRAMGFELFIDTLETATTAPNEPEKLYVYVRGSADPTHWRRIKEITWPATSLSAGTTVQWDGAMSGDEPTITEYVHRPLVGSRLMLPHKGRMLYTLDDVLYISDWDHPEQVPIAPTFNANPDKGGWITIGEDGQDITGLGPWGSFLLIMKELGVYRMEGDTADNIAIVPMSTVAGCVSHETVQQIADSMTVWLGHNKVWICTPDGITDIGEPIRELLENHSLTVQRQAFAVYDRQRKWYILTLPDTTPVSYVLYRSPSGWGWTRWTNQPNGCAIYAPSLTTPGVYVGDKTNRIIDRANTGVSDGYTGTTYTNGTAITYSWTGGKEAAPSVTVRKSVRDIYVHAGNNPLEDGEVQLPATSIRLWHNGAGGDYLPATSAVSKTIDATKQFARWSPPSMVPAERVQVLLSGAVSTGGEIVAIEEDLAVRGSRR